MREANEIDFWRGWALVSIFVNHIPGFAFERFTHRNFGLSDSAELFVFLAGWSLRHLADDAAATSGLGRLVLRLLSRAVTLYAAQILITMLALALIAGSALGLGSMLLLDWHNAGPVFQEPVTSHLGLVFLTHQLGYFDILPLYVVLMLVAAPAIAVGHALVPWIVLPASLAVYAYALSFAVNLPTWPVEGTWYFDPFAWQLVFVLGFTVAGWRRHAALWRHWGIRACGLAIVLGLGAFAIMNPVPPPLNWPEPRLLFVVDKTYVTPLRLIHFLALAATFAGLFPAIRAACRPLAAFLSMLGRNSLNVFCVGSLFSLLAQIARFTLGNDVKIDAAIFAAGVVALGFTAWLSELRERLRMGHPGPSRQARPSSSS